MITKVYSSSLHFCLNTQYVKDWHVWILQTCKIFWKFPKISIKSGHFITPALPFGILTYHNVYINQVYNFWNFGEDTVGTSDINGCQLCIKIPKKLQYPFSFHYNFLVFFFYEKFQKIIISKQKSFKLDIFVVN